MTSSSAETPLPFSREDISREEERGSEEGETWQIRELII